jgi:RNA polymerase nonessential primary-like sigma factor
MIRAAKKFDPTKGFRYGTLASAYIKTGLILAIRNTGRRIRLPVRVHEKLKQIHKAEIELGEGATLEEIAREANISVPWAKIYIEARNMQILEMDAPLRGDAGESTGTFHDILHVVVDDDALKNTIYGLEQEELKAFLKTTLATKFDERKTRIIEHLFALNGRKKFSAATLSRRCKVSERRINQIKNEVLDKLRELLEKEGF